MGDQGEREQKEGKAVRPPGISGSKKELHFRDGLAKRLALASWFLGWALFLGVWAYSLLALISTARGLGQVDSESLERAGWFTAIALGYSFLGPVPWRRLRARGLLAGFTLTVAPLALAALGLIASLPFVTEFLASEPSKVTLPASSTAATESGDQGLGFFVAVDVSRSVLDGGGTDAGSEDLVDRICSTVRELLEGSSPAPIMPISATFATYTFTDETKTTTLRTNQLGDQSVSQAADRFCEELKNIEKDHVSPAGDPSQTDVIGLVEETLAHVEPMLGEFHHVTLMVFSDFVQDLKISTPDLELKRLREVAARVRRLGDRFSSSSSGGSTEQLFSIVGVTLPQDERYRGDTSLDLLPTLRSDLPKQWSEASLKDLSTHYSEARSTILEGLMYKRVALDDPFYLKYSWGPFPPSASKLILPPGEDLEYLSFRLRAWPDRGPLPESFSVQFGTKDEVGRDQGVLLFCRRSEPWRTHQLVGSAANELHFKLASQLDSLGTGRFELLVAVPRRMAVYVIPVLVTPVGGKVVRDIHGIMLFLFTTAIIVVVATEIIHLFQVGTRTWRVGRNRGAIEARPESEG